MSHTQDWFASWFDTPYYHMLYKHRDDTEARDFIDRLFEELNPKPADKILDLACGRGRHAVYMHAKGHHVTGYDLAPENIAYASTFAKPKPKLNFAVRDMREELGDAAFDWVFNLFTSFGYFEEPDDDQKAMNAIAKCLKPGGMLVMDFMNANRVANRLVPKETKVANGITFNIERFTRGEHIVKEIKFTTANRHFQFEEKVKTLNKADFVRLFTQAGLKLIKSYGSLQLEPFDVNASDRLILIAQKQ